MHRQNYNMDNFQKTILIDKVPHGGPILKLKHYGVLSQSI